MNKYISQLLKLKLNKTSDYPKKQFLEERLSTNFFREKIYSIILIAWNAFMMVYTGIGAFNGTWDHNAAYKYEFYLHLAGLVLPAIFMRLAVRKNKFGKILNIVFIAAGLHWMTLMTLIDLSISQQITVYCMGILAVSISLIMDIWENVLIYLSTYIVLVAGTLLTSDRPGVIESSVLNGLILVVLGVVISRMIFSLRINDFIKSKTIAEKTKELENSHIELEQALKKRTEELASANEQLVREINARHEAEMKALNSELKYQKKLAELNKQMEYEKLQNEFFTNISHELRTPLSIISCTLQMINSRYKDQHEEDYNNTGRYLKMMKQNCYRLTRQINNIIDITKIDSGYFSINLGNHDIVDIVENITQAMVPFAESCSFKVVFDTEMEEKVIACDPDAIVRIMLNLFSNALKIVSPQKNIFVNIFNMNDYVIIKVKDTGIGIPEEKQKVIFDRFVKLEKQAISGNAGNGIGLSLVKSLVEMHNGRIDVISEPGMGTEFIIELPDCKVKTEEDSTEYISRSMDKMEAIKLEFSDICDTKCS